MQTTHSGRTVTAVGFDGFEQQQYGIKASGKAFKVLLNTIYTNKIRAAIRETATNAFDAHVAAGTAHLPFDMQLPTVGNPTFRIRDYGESMSHQQVMHLYTTVFESSKEDTNSQVGQLGLGSKAPFAYTDAFTVVAWKDGEKRTYLANIDDEGRPMLRHLGTVASDEPQGIEISFPVEQQHFGEFVEEARQVCLGFDIKPNMLSGPLDVPEPLFKDGNWRVFQGLPNGVRQGCVIYPVMNHQLHFDSPLNHGYGFVVDVPIGTVDIAANREALSLDDDTKRKVVEAFEAAAKEFLKYVQKQVEAAPNRLEAEIAFYKWSKSCMNINYVRRIGIKWRGEALKGYIDLCPDPKNPPPHLPEKVLDYKEKTIAPGDLHFSLSSLVEKNSKLVFILDKNTRQIPRRRLRIRQYRKEEYGRYAPSMYILVDATPAQINYVKTELGLTDDYFIKVEDLPDVTPSPKAPKGTGTGQIRSGTYRADANSDWRVERIETDSTLPPKYVWFSIDKYTPGQRVWIPELGGNCELHQLPGFYARFCQQLGVPAHPFFMLTTRAEGRYLPDPANGLIELVKRTFKERRGYAIRRTHAMHLGALISQHGTNNIDGWCDQSTGIWDSMWNLHKFSFRNFRTNTNFPRSNYDQMAHPWIERLFHQHRMEHHGGIDVQERAKKKARQDFQQIKQMYPLLFQDADSQHVHAYVKAQKNPTTQKAGNP